MEGQSRAAQHLQNCRAPSSIPYPPDPGDSHFSAKNSIQKIISTPQYHVSLAGCAFATVVIDMSVLHPGDNDAMYKDYFNASTADLHYLHFALRTGSYAWSAQFIRPKVLTFQKASGIGKAYSTEYELYVRV